MGKIEPLPQVFSLSGRGAVITGGAGLLGREHAAALLEAGARVALLDISIEALAKASAGFPEEERARVATIACDITREEAVSKALAELAGAWGEAPHILVNNAAIDPKFEKDSTVNRSRLEHFPLEQWNRELAVGLTGSMVCAKVFGSAMAAAGRGVILNIASDLGLIAPDQRLYRKEGLPEGMQSVKPVTYSVIKHGLIGLTRYLATYWPERGVRCNAFAPGGVFNNHADPFLANLTRLIPMGRMARLGEYRGAVLFLCSDASSYMNGAVLAMDGGRSTW
ncbi:MAG: SDR family oxidoreductase [Spirochaetes bacterium]|nr:SDR family oxidoreductase [Spirochaetota bacterium]